MNTLLNFIKFASMFDLEVNPTSVRIISENVDKTISVDLSESNIKEGRFNSVSNIHELPEDVQLVNVNVKDKKLTLSFKTKRGIKDFDYSYNPEQANLSLPEMKEFVVNYVPNNQIKKLFKTLDKSITEFFNGVWFNFVEHDKNAYYCNLQQIKTLDFNKPDNIDFKFFYSLDMENYRTLYNLNIVKVLYNIDGQYEYYGVEYDDGTRYICPRMSNTSSYYQSVINVIKNDITAPQDVDLILPYDQYVKLLKEIKKEGVIRLKLSNGVCDVSSKDKQIMWFPLMNGMIDKEVYVNHAMLAEMMEFFNKKDFLTIGIVNDKMLSISQGKRSMLVAGLIKTRCW